MKLKIPAIPSFLKKTRTWSIVAAVAVAGNYYADGQPLQAIKTLVAAAFGIN